MNEPRRPAEHEQAREDRVDVDETDERQYHPWRLLAVLVGVLVILGGIAAAINVAVLGW
jgi:hypothetical protein